MSTSFGDVRGTQNKHQPVGTRQGVNAGTSRLGLLRLPFSVKKHQMGLGKLLDLTTYGTEVMFSYCRGTCSRCGRRSARPQGGVKRRLMGSQIAKRTNHPPRARSTAPDVYTSDVPELCCVQTAGAQPSVRTTGGESHHNAGGMPLTCSTRHACRLGTRSWGGECTATSGSGGTSRSPFPPADVSRSTTLADLPGKVGTEGQARVSRERMNIYAAVLHERL